MDIQSQFDNPVILFLTDRCQMIFCDAIHFCARVLSQEDVSFFSVRRRVL